MNNINYLTYMTLTLEFKRAKDEKTKEEIKSALSKLFPEIYEEWLRINS